MYSSTNGIIHTKVAPSMPGQNQLLFNLDVQPQPYKSAFQFHKPQPIILDKGGPLAPTFHHNHRPVMNESSTSVTGGMNFSSLSEDRLNIAVRLAQRDLKKKKENRHLIGKPDSRSPSPKGKTRIIPGKKYWDRQHESSKRGQPYREHDRNRHPKDVRTQTPPRMPHSKAFPVTTDSPPTRDTDFKLYPVKRSIPSDQPAKEIERLQREMEGYLQQIQVIEQRVLIDKNSEFLKPSKSRKKEGYLPQEEDEVRKKLRSEELATREARQIYVLRQQVRQVQQELTKSGSDKTKHTKKSQAMARLAAAHRYAVRTIQSFVTNLPNTDLHTGLPSSYHELALLIRQMSLLSTQMSSDGKSSVQDDLVKMLDRVDELNKAWCAEVTTTQPGDTSIQPETQQRQKSPASRPKPVFKTTVLKGKENKPYKGVLKKPTVKKTQVNKQQVAWNTGTPERKAMLRAGIEALMDTSDLQQHRDGMAWNISLQEEQQKKPASKTSLILPGKLQTQRMKAQKAVKQQQYRPVLRKPVQTAATREQHIPSQHMSDKDIHYRDPTLSSSLKALSPRERSLSPGFCDRSFSAPASPRGYPWIPSGTPRSQQRRTRSQSPRSRYMDLDRSDIVQTLFPGEHQSRPRTRGRVSDKSLSLSERMIRDAEKKIQTRLKPLLQKAELIAFQQEEKSKTKRKQLADKALASFEDSGDDLTNMILSEVLDDTVHEYKKLERNGQVHREAVTMQDNPTLENIFQRLEEMEMESHNIRRRWAAVQFEDVKTAKQVIRNPLAPMSMEISKSQGPVIKERPIGYDKEHGDQPIIFTRSKGETLVKNRVLELDDLSVAKPTSQRAPTLITLPDELVYSINSSRDTYDRYLKKTSHHPLGRFDPWILAEEVSNLILEDCFKDIAGELEETNEAIMNQVCKSEFMVNNTSEIIEPPQETKTTIYKTEDVKMTAYETAPTSSKLTEPISTASLNPDYSDEEFEDEEGGYSDEYEDITDEDEDD